MRHLDKSICGNFVTASGKEWLETNGLGGFACSTVMGLNRRRYHGLLIAAVRPPAERLLLLAQLDETLIINGQAAQLSTCQYGGGVAPRGYRFLQEFRLNPGPVFVFQVGPVKLEKRLFMVRGENTTVVRYRLVAPAEVEAELLLRPLVSFRTIEALQRESDEVPGAGFSEGLVHLEQHRASLYLAHDAATVFPEGAWQRGVVYAGEGAEEADYQEDLYNPCTLSFTLRGGGYANLIASTEPHRAGEAPLLERHERARRHLFQGMQEPEDFLHSLFEAAGHFVVQCSPYRKTIIGGYPWHQDGGRVAMMALPGLTLTTERYDQARAILSAFAESVCQGLIPDSPHITGSTLEFHNVDASLWFFHAVNEYLRHTRDDGFVWDHLYTHLKEIIGCYEQGTRQGIHLGSDGLLYAGLAGEPLTWMAARIDGAGVTPRNGKAVEVQALWYNALKVTEGLAQRFHDAETRARCQALATYARISFNHQFWYDEGAYLYDFIDPDGTKDAALRPNQIFAVSLPYALLSPERARAVVAACQETLLTPYGLRSLSPHHPAYQPHCAGDAAAQQRAWHQGSVFPWLLGPFLTAYLKVHEHSPASIRQAHAWLTALRGHLYEGGLGHIAEVFDGDPPHMPRGCFAHAGNVAELLRCAVEELGWRAVTHPSVLNDKKARMAA